VGGEKHGEEGNEMKEDGLLGIVVCVSSGNGICAREIEVPVWNVGDKWVFDQGGPMEVVNCDAKCFSVRFSGGIFRKDASGIAVFDRSTLNVKYTEEKDQPKEYWDLRKKALNFPLTLGKQWMDVIQYDALQQWASM